jgi:hypothetical protein
VPPLPTCARDVDRRSALRSDRDSIAIGAAAPAAWIMASPWSPNRPRWLRVVCRRRNPLRPNRDGLGCRRARVRNQKSSEVEKSAAASDVRSGCRTSSMDYGQSVVSEQTAVASGSLQTAESSAPAQQQTVSSKPGRQRTFRRRQLSQARLVVTRFCCLAALRCRRRAERDRECTRRASLHLVYHPGSTVSVRGVSRDST